MVRNRRLPSVMSHSFAQVPSARIQRSSFDRSCGLKTTFDAGYLIPIFCDEVLPGDTFSLKEAFLARMATPIFPPEVAFVLALVLLLTPKKLSRDQ